MEPGSSRGVGDDRSGVDIDGRCRADDVTRGDEASDVIGIDRLDDETLDGDATTQGGGDVGVGVEGEDSVDPADAIDSVGSSRNQKNPCGPIVRGYGWSSIGQNGIRPNISTGVMPGYSRRSNSTA